MKEIERQIYEKPRSLYDKHGAKSNKFLGSMTIEVIKKFLKGEGFDVSERDCFIQGVSNEIDLLIFKKDTTPIFNSYYKPEDVLCVFEIKSRGLYGESDINHIKTMFENVRKVNPKIKCVYLTVYENQKYKYKATKENINGEVFELFKPPTSMDSALKKEIFFSSASGDWNKLIDFLKN